MNDQDDFITRTLQRGADAAPPDLDRLAADAVRGGRAIRRRRTTGVVLATAACIALGTVAATVLPRVGADEAGFGSSPSASASVSPSDTPTPTPDPSGAPRDVGPVALDLPGWSCEVFLVDEKMWCTAERGDEGVSVVFRRARDHDSFGGKYGAVVETFPMLGGEGELRPGVVIGPARRGTFVSVQPGPGLSNRELKELAQALVWTAK